jgi:hypothetical protein
MFLTRDSERRPQDRLCSISGTQGKEAMTLSDFTKETSR